jgi:transposase
MERLHMNYLRDLIYRLRENESERHIAQDLKISRPTVHKYKEWAESHGYLDPAHTLPELGALVAKLGQASRPPQMGSSLEPHRETVKQLLEQGVEMTAIRQRLQENHGYRGSYSAVRRFVRRLRPAEPTAVVRVQTEPGEEMQVDFGSVGQLFDTGSGRLRPAYVFVATLSYSRHQYAELVFDQKIPTWVALHRRAFESFGGVLRRVVPDNLKAAVIECLVYDPILGEAYRRMALHYGFLVSPTRPRTPQHKGKVENGVHYIQRNFMAGQDFVDLESANARLKVWVREVAGVRDHGTTRQAPLRLFHDYEQGQLQPLPATAFTLRQIKPAKVHPDCHVTLEGSYYSAPYRYIGQRLDAYVSDHPVELYDGVTLVSTHIRSTEPGEWQTRSEDYPAEKAAYLVQTPQFCRCWAAKIGLSTRRVVETLLNDRPLDRLRAVQAILRLEESVGAPRLEAACARALHFDDVRYVRVKQILSAGLDRVPLPDTASLPEPARSFAFARSSQDFFPPEVAVRPC